MKREFLAVDDYGNGGIWLAIRAESAAAIKKRYPELDVFEELPSFLTDAVVEKVRANRSYDLDDASSGYLAEIVADRRE